jgi:hypothetical protein
MNERNYYSDKKTDLPTTVIIQRGFCPILEKFVPLAKLISLRTIPTELSTPKS